MYSVFVYIYTMYSHFPWNWEPWKVPPTTHHQLRGALGEVNSSSLSAPLSLSCQFLMLLSLLPRRRCLVRLLTRQFRGPRSGHTANFSSLNRFGGKYSVYYFHFTVYGVLLRLQIIICMHPWTSPTGCLCLTCRRVRALPRALQGGSFLHTVCDFSIFDTT